MTLLSTMRGLLQSEGDVSLQVLASRYGRSRFHFQRLFRQFAGETPKAFLLRLRLERAAAALLATDTRILAISRAAGFRSHEVFSRAFVRHFGRTPMQHRRLVPRDWPASGYVRYRRLVQHAGPCIRLHHLTLAPRRTSMPLLSIEKKEIAPLPFLFIRRRVARSELSGALAECFGAVYAHCMQAALPMAGFPLARYPLFGPGLITVEAGVPLLHPATPVGEMEYAELPGGPVVFAIHAGPYDALGDTHAAIERWMQQRGLRPASPLWEWYVTDPGEHPDSAEWRTQIFQPVC